MSSTLRAAQNNYDLRDDDDNDGPVRVASSSESETENYNNNGNLQRTQEEEEANKSSLDGTQTTIDSSSSGGDSSKTTQKKPYPHVAAVAVGLPYSGGERVTSTLSAAERAAKEAAKMNSSNPPPPSSAAAAARAGEDDGSGIELTNTSTSSPADTEDAASAQGEEGNLTVEPSEEQVEALLADEMHDVENPSPPAAEAARFATTPNEEPEAAPPETERNRERDSSRNPPPLPIAEAVQPPNLEIPEPTEGTVIAAELVHEEPKEEGRRCFGRLLSSTQWTVGALLIIVLIVVGIVVGLIPRDGCDEDDRENCEKAEELMPSTAPTTFVEVTESPTTAPVSCDFHDPFAADLHFLTSQALKEPCSPQSKANSWMMQDPYLDTYSKPRQLQRFALVTLYYSTGGENWKNKDSWLSYDEDECQWFNQGMDEVDRVCDDEFGMIHLNLSGNNLDGVLPVELFLFHALAVLDLSRNSLKGTAPTMFQGAKYLKRLDLSSNQLTGQFTAELGFVASNLSILQNDDNQFTGAVPGLLRLLPSLSRLNITGNLYTGALPESLIQLRSTLVAIEVANNAITGAIPSELGAAKNLELFDVRGNHQMRGRIPAELGTLSNLKMFDISGTGISGSLPGDLCLLEDLTLVAECEGPFQCC